MQSQNTLPFSFVFAGCYMGESDYTTHCNGESIKIRVLETLNDYRRTIYNGGPKAFDREVTPVLHCAWRHNNPTRQLPDDLVAALNAYRAAYHKKILADLESQPHRYGVLAADDPFRTPPPLLCGAYLDQNNQWIIDRHKKAAA